MALDFDSARLPNPHLTEAHEAWRTQLRRFVDTEIAPFADDWDEAGEIPAAHAGADAWLSASETNCARRSSQAGPSKRTSPLGLGSPLLGRTPFRDSLFKYQILRFLRA